MMRPGFCTSLVASALAVLLAACGGAPPTATPPPTAAAEVPTIEVLESRPTPPGESTPDVGPGAERLPGAELDSEAQAAIATMNALVIEPLPPPGTLVVLPRQADQADTVYQFETIVFTQSGGPADVEYRTEIRRDGTVLRDDETLTISPAEVEAVNDLINDFGFFNIQGTFTGPSLGSDAYEYTLRVDLVDGSSRTLFAQDGMMPRAIIDLFLQISAVGEPTTVPTATAAE